MAILAIQIKKFTLPLDFGDGVNYTPLMKQTERIQVRLDKKTKVSLEKVAISNRWDLSTAARYMIQDALVSLKTRPASEIDRIGSLSHFSAPKQ